MPHLTSAPANTAGTGLGPGLGIPGLAHPLIAPEEWDALTHPLTPVHWVVLNVSCGPGARPDPYCLRAARRLHAAGLRVLGHLDVTHGARPFGELVFEAHRYLDWYHVDGFLLDRCPTERALLPEICRTLTTLRVLLGGGHIVLGHGSHPCPEYADHADQLVTFRGPWSDYRWSQAAKWTANHPPERFCHFVHGVPRRHLEEALRTARWQGAATVWFTDRTDRGGRTAPWETMPGYWDDVVSRLGTGVLE